MARPKHMSYRPHRAFIAPALPTAELPRLVLGILGVEFLYGMAIGGLAQLLDLLGLDTTGFYYGDTTAGMLAELLSFGLLGALVTAAARSQHGRGFFTLTGPPLTALRHLKTTFIAVLALLLALELMPPYWDSDSLAATRPLLPWLALLPVSLAALAIQTGAEELFYRGYIQQQLAARFKSPLVWLSVPSLLFALAHWNNGTTPTESMQYVIWAFLFGLAAADLTARTGTLGAAIGFHLANNVIAFTLFGELDAPGSGLALLLFEPAGADLLPPPAYDPVLTATLMTELAVLLLMWLAARIALRR